MKRIDTSKWKTFSIGDLFTISRPVARSQLKYREGTIPFVASGNYNNGVVKWCEPTDDDVLDQKGCITVSPLDGSAFYQPIDFLGRGGAGSAILLLRNDNLTEMRGLFISAILRATLTKFSYNDQINSQTILIQEIKLPAVLDGSPDWKYMDQYMQKIMKESEKSLESLRRVDKSKESVDFADWKEFPVSGLFDIHPTKAYKLTNEQLLDDNGKNPIVVNSGFNNGIGGYTNYDCTEQAGIITFTDTAAKSTESFFYQDHDFVGYPHVQGMYPKNHKLTKYEGMFVATILRASVGKYDFISKMTRDDILSLTIQLPAASDGSPDWKYMKIYMDKILRKTSTAIKQLKKVI